MIVSRRAYLLSRPSENAMRAAGRASASDARQRGRSAVQQRHAELLARAGVSSNAPGPVVYLPPTLYDQAERQGHNMAGYAKTQPIPTR